MASRYCDDDVVNRRRRWVSSGDQASGGINGKSRWQSRSTESAAGRGCRQRHLIAEGIVNVEGSTFGRGDSRSSEAGHRPADREVLGVNPATRVGNVSTHRPRRR